MLPESNIINIMYFRNITKPLCFIFFTFLLICCGFSAKSQQYQTYITDTYFDRGDYRLMLRPVFYTMNSNKLRFDAAIGKKRIIKNIPLDLYAYYSGNTRNQQWMGIKSETFLYFLNKRLRFKLQLRYWWGLNSKTRNKYYLMPSLSYRLANFGKTAENNKKLWKLSLGVWSMYRETLGYKARQYVGPSVSLSYKNSGIFVAYNDDIVSDRYWLFCLFYYKINCNKK